jgi:glutathione synthase/RimK-type ligase-like ATP-grasp enzyme
MRVSADKFERLPQAIRELSFWIRNHANGWIFGRHNVVSHPEAARISVAAIGALGLDFGAVDVRVRDSKAVVLEVNSAPGLTGNTLAAYTAKIKEYVHGH